MLEILGSVLTGGVTGLLGTAITGVMKFFEKKQEHKNKLELMEMEMRQMDKEASIARDIAELKMEGEESKAQWDALQASYRESTARMSSGDSIALVAVDVVRGLMRPVITLGLLILMAVIYFQLSTAPEQQRIIATVLYMATTCTLWWFGTRPLEKGKKSD